MSRSAGESVREAEMEVGELEELTVSRRERERGWRVGGAGLLDAENRNGERGAAGGGKSGLLEAENRNGERGATERRERGC